MVRIHIIPFCKIIGCKTRKCRSVHQFIKDSIICLYQELRRRHFLPAHGIPEFKFPPQQNFDLFDFTLSAEDMAAIEALDGGESLFFSHYDPKTVEWFMSIL